MLLVVKPPIRQRDINLLVDLQRVKELTHHPAIWELLSLVVDLNEQLKGFFPVDSRNGRILSGHNFTVNNRPEVTKKVTKFKDALRL